MRVALRRASCCALAIQAAAYAVKGTFFIRPVAAHGMEQANQPFLHRIVKVKAGCCNGSGAFAYGRHHGGDQRGAGRGARLVP